MRRAWRMEDDGCGEALLKRFEMWDKRDKLGKELSKGMQQKLSICCQLVHRPKAVSYTHLFYGCDSLTTVTLPDSLTTIGDYAFFFCSSLTTITLPDSLTTIGAYAFSGCDSLTTITLPEGLTTIGDSAFQWCGSLTTVTLPDSLTTI